MLPSFFTLQRVRLVKISLINFGMFFQEYDIAWENFFPTSKVSRTKQLNYIRFKFLHTTWLLFTFFLIMFFYSNRKASFVIKLYEKEVTTLDEIIER